MPAAMPDTRKSAKHGGALKLHRRATFGGVSGAGDATCGSGKVRNVQGSWHDPCHNTYITRAQGLGEAAHLPTNGDASEAERAPPHQRQARFREARPGRGGARNRADRESHALTIAQLANLGAAERHARAIGLPMTRMVSIHWEAAGVPLSGMVKATGRYIDLLSKTLARHGSQTAWLWVLENGHGKGGHCHVLVHVPAALVPCVTALQKRWLRRITGNPYRARVIRSGPIGGRLGLEAGNPDLHVANVKAALAYVLKGASPEAASKFDLERLEPGGRIIGKRCATSQNIAAKARREWTGQ